MLQSIVHISIIRYVGDWTYLKESRYYTNEFYKGKKGVCAAKGFVANGLNCGLNSDKK